MGKRNRVGVSTVVKKENPWALSPVLGKTQRASETSSGDSSPSRKLDARRSGTGEELCAAFIERKGRD
jgi:hypothetical protein